MATLGTRWAIATFGALALGLTGCMGLGTSAPSPPSCSPSSSSAAAIAYTIGASTNPYGESAPAGFGVAWGLPSGQLRRVEVRRNGLGSSDGAAWIAPGRLEVPVSAPPFRAPLIYRYGNEHLCRVGAAPLPGIATAYWWSPSGDAIVEQRMRRCNPHVPLGTCSKQAPGIRIDHDGRSRMLTRVGSLDEWTPDGRILVTVGNQEEAFSPAAGKPRLILPDSSVAAAAGVNGTVQISQPRWSADGRYIAAFAGVDWKTNLKRSTIVVAHSDGRIIRFLTSPYDISMFAWSPTGHNLAYTTSGFPAPHQLIMLTQPDAPTQTVYATDRHFDWFTWSPNARWLLVDDGYANRWRLIPTNPGGHVRTLPRLGGRPLWCCPVQEYGGQ